MNFWTLSQKYSISIQCRSSSRWIGFKSCGQRFIKHLGRFMQGIASSNLSARSFDSRMCAQHRCNRFVNPAYGFPLSHTIVPLNHDWSTSNLAQNGIVFRLYHFSSATGQIDYRSRARIQSMQSPQCILDFPMWQSILVLQQSCLRNYVISESAFRGTFCIAGNNSFRAARTSVISYIIFSNHDRALINSISRLNSSFSS